MKRKGELPSNGDSTKESRVSSASRQFEIQERENLVIWRKPIKTVDFFIRESFIKIVSVTKQLSQYRRLLFTAFVALICLLVSLNVDGPHVPYLEFIRKKAIWCAYWIGLGVLSSIGLGTGLHTFLLYLGPHIAAVTLAAYECGSLNFPEPPYPDDIMCPDKIDISWAVSIWNIMRKIHLEAIMWGAGTALGELPPYFMAKASRLSGHNPDVDDLKEFEELQKKKENPENMNLLDRAKLMIEELVNKVGFFGILVCASIPNPLFDLAGITCGHFLVPFWTFFGATLIGKAIIKMSLQTMFVIVAFSDVLIKNIMEILGIIPLYGGTLQDFLQRMLQMQRARLHRGYQSNVEVSSSPVAAAFEVFVVAMVGYFIVSIINSLAQSYHKRIYKKKEGSKRNKEE
uniref:Putative conserved plasma membrane protein n=1 Tax=Panstrongylus megistus TaxID=65343 RepID=A0A069DTT6_9HEMI